MDIHSINSDVLFPDMAHYDMKKAGDMALYLAHCDFYPFRSVIENNKIALDAINESYRSIEEKARLDGYYVENLSFGMDVKCFLGTVKSVLNREGVVEGGN